MDKTKEKYASNDVVSKDNGREKHTSIDALFTLTFDTADTELLYITEYNKQHLGNDFFYLLAPIAFLTLNHCFRFE